MGFTSYSDIDPALVQHGAYFNTVVFSPSGPAGGARGFWFDDSILPGYPNINAYAGNERAASLLDESRGIRHWNLAPGETEHLLEWTVASQEVATFTDAPYSMLLCDYVMFYPNIDANIDTLQTLDNTITLPRYQSGEGLRAFIVSTNGSTPSAGEYEITYTNSDGVSGKTSRGLTVAANTSGLLLTSSVPGSLVPNQHVPFIWLDTGCRGIRRIDSIRWIAPPGGRVAIVLVRTIASISNTESTSIAESQYFERMPEIERGAYLGVLRHPGAAVIAGVPYMGQITTIKG